MSEQLGHELPPVEALSDPYQGGIYRKVDVAWGSNVGDRGYADPYEVAARIYDALYYPGRLQENMDRRALAANPDIPHDRLPSQVLRPATREALLEPLELRGQAPATEELKEFFIQTVAEAILSADVADTILLGAREQIVTLIKWGYRPAIWSAGHPEHQHRKLGQAGLRPTAAIADTEPSVEVTTRHGPPIGIETVIAPNKTTPEVFARVREIAGNAPIVVVDDRVKNLMKFRDGVPEAKAAIWVQYGAHAKGEMDKLAQGENPQLAKAIEGGAIIPIKTIDELAQKIAELRSTGVLTGEQAVVFLDFDDTLGNNKKRRAIELDAVVSTLFDRGWV